MDLIDILISRRDVIIFSIDMQARIKTSLKVITHCRYYNNLILNLMSRIEAKLCFHMVEHLLSSTKAESFKV